MPSSSAITELTTEANNPIQMLMDRPFIVRASMSRPSQSVPNRPPAPRRQVGSPEGRLVCRLRDQGSAQGRGGEDDEAYGEHHRRRLAAVPAFGQFLGTVSSRAVMTRSP